MGSKKSRKAADSVTKGEIAGAQVHESQTKEQQKKKLNVVKPTSELHGQQVPAEEPEKTMKAEKTTKAKKSEIDDIFGLKKRKKAEGAPDDEVAQAAAKKKDKANSEVVKLNSKGELVKPKKPQVAKPTKSTPAAAAAAPASRKKTEDGFTVYTAEELGFNKKNAGGTKLCPFDCDCCF